MDEKLKQVIAELKEVGFDDEKLAMYLSLVFDDFMDIVKGDIANLEDDQVTVIETTLKQTSISDITSGTENKILKDVLEKLYGLSGMNKYKEFLYTELKQALEDVKKVQDVLKEYNPDDPESVAKLEALKNDPNYLPMYEALKHLKGE